MRQEGEDRSDAPIDVLGDGSPAGSGYVVGPASGSDVVRVVRSANQAAARTMPRPATAIRTVGQARVRLRTSRDRISPNPETDSHGKLDHQP